jgi:hypothetical protein
MLTMMTKYRNNPKKMAPQNSRKLQESFWCIFIWRKKSKKEKKTNSLFYGLKTCFICPKGPQQKTIL